jgi:uncharacterized membrane protein
MDDLGHLWAIGFDTPTRAAEVRSEVLQLLADHYLILADVIVVVRRPDGTFQYEREQNQPVANILGCGLVGALIGLVVLHPLEGAAIGSAVGAAGSLAAHYVGLCDDFIRSVQDLMRPGTSALFLLANATDEDVVLHQIRGLGGSILKTNVDLAWAERVRQALASGAATAR